MDKTRREMATDSLLGPEGLAKGHDLGHASLGSVGVNDVAGWLDGLELGWFHKVHLARMVFAFTALATVQESTPYMFSSLETEYDLSSEGLGTFASAFHIGCVLGSGVGALTVDSAGRHVSARHATVVTALCGVLMTVTSVPFGMVVVIRAIQSCAWTVCAMAMQAWFAEFLPTKGRGTLLATYAIGWPLGRGVAIIGSRLGLKWRALSLLSSTLLTGFGFAFTYTSESPRFLASIGKGRQARAVVERMYSQNGQRLPELFGGGSGPDALVSGGGSSVSACLFRLHQLRTLYGRLTAYAIMLFVVLAITTVLIDTWGPTVFQRLLNSEDGLPHEVLFLFNVGDLCGIIVSINVVDRIGRRGSFFVGFGAQAGAFVLLALVSMSFSALPGARSSVIILVGFFTAATRCFGWEAAHMWTVEVFPTSVRATAIAVTGACMRLAAVGTVMASAAAAKDAPPGYCLLFVAAMLLVGFGVAYSLPKETANAPMGERSIRDTS